MHRILGLSLFNICTAFSACAVTVVDTVYTLVYTLVYTDGINRAQAENAVHEFLRKC